MKAKDPRAEALVGALALLTVLQSACSPEATEAPPRALTEVVQAGRVEVRYAKRFAIEYRTISGQQVIVATFNAPLVSWSKPGDAEVRKETVVLLRKGVPLPELPKDLAGQPLVRFPVEKVAVNAEADEAFLAVINRSDRLVAVGGKSSFDDRIRERVERGELGQIGYTWHSAPNFETILARGAGLLFMRLVSLDLASSLTRARSLGIPVVPTFDWAEETYLGRAEWVKLFGLLLGADAEARAYFERLEARVGELKRLTAGVTARPSVLWAFYGGGQRFVAYHRGVEEEFLNDAGARSATAALDQPWRDGGTALPTEQLLALAKDADIWIIGDAHAVDAKGSPTDLPPESVMSLFKPWREKRLYHNYKRRKVEHNSFDWFESHGVRPDLVLEDLITIAHPELLGERELHYFDPFVR